MTFKKLSKRYTGILTPLVVSFMMSCIVSAISVIRAQGLNADFLHIWPSAWAFSWLVAFPLLFVVLPMARRIVALIVEQ